MLLNAENNKNDYSCVGSTTTGTTGLASTGSV
jgi:hypothetical protein